MGVAQGRQPRRRKSQPVPGELSGGMSGLQKARCPEVVGVNAESTCSFIYAISLRVITRNVVCGHTGSESILRHRVTLGKLRSSLVVFSFTTLGKLR